MSFPSTCESTLLFIFLTFKSYKKQYNNQYKYHACAAFNCHIPKKTHLLENFVDSLTILIILKHFIF